MKTSHVLFHRVVYDPNERILLWTFILVTFWTREGSLMRSTLQMSQRVEPIGVCGLAVVICNNTACHV